MMSATRRTLAIETANADAREWATVLLCELVTGPESEIPSEPTKRAWRTFYRECSPVAASTFVSEWRSGAAQLRRCSPRYQRSVS